MGRGGKTMVRIASLAIAYNEERLIGKHLKHIPDFVEEKLVLVTDEPWNGEPDEPDNTADIARQYATTIIGDWKNEKDQRNFGLDYLSEYDWVVVLDPDEFLDNKNWAKLYEFVQTAERRSYVVKHQHTYWKDGYVAHPKRDYQQIILAPPRIRFIDNRVVNDSYGTADICVHHFSWARTDREVLSKITHYGHANEIDFDSWYQNVWLKWKPGMKDVHPNTPETLHELIPATLPPELEELNLWP